MGSNRTYAAVIGTLIATAPLFSQPTPDAKPAFDVASIKPSVPGSRQHLTIEPGGRLSLNSFSVEALIAISHRLQPFEISGADGWVKSERWAIEAKAEDVSRIPAWSPPYLPEVIAARLRALLEDRFSLRVHGETRELKAYVLAIGKGGAKLVPADPPVPSTPDRPSTLQPPAQGGSPAGPKMPAGSMAAGPGVLIASAVTMDQMVTYLNKIMDLPVIDKTGLTGNYNFKLRFAPESSRPLSAPPSEGATPEVTAAGEPSILVAIHEQLGLDLRPAKVPVHVLVIDSARRPAEN